MTPREEFDEFDERVGRELHRRAEDLRAEPLGLDAVRGQASAIRRRRWIASGLAAAAAVAVIVPTALIASRQPRTDEPLPATQSPSVSEPPSGAASPSTATDSPPSSPSSSASSTPVQGPKPHALDVRDLPTGAPPGITVISMPEGEEVPLGYAVTGEAEVWWTIDGVEANLDGQGFGYSSSSSGLARNAAGTIVAWATDDGQVMAWQDGGSEPLTLGSTPLTSLQVSAVTGDDCRPGGDCQVWLRAYDDSAGGPVSVTVSADGTVATVDGLVQVRDALDDGRILGHTEIRDDGSCSAALEGSTTLLGSCDYTFDAFSPTGDYVLASDPYHSGDASGVIAVFATVGDRLAYRVRTNEDLASYWQAAWEDETHILFTAYQDGQWSVVRMGVDGALEYAMEPVPGSREDCPFVLETL